MGAYGEKELGRAAVKAAYSGVLVERLANQLEDPLELLQTLVVRRRELSGLDLDLDVASVRGSGLDTGTRG
ncbi:MAG: hypothetical protein ABI869_05090 [Actinomycetota bacterium]